MNSTCSDSPNPRSRPRSFITMHRINFLLVLVFLITTLAGCGGCKNGCNCSKENGQQAVKISCQLTGRVIPNCNKVCQFRIQFYDEATGNNLTNVHSSSKVDFDILAAGSPDQYFYDQPIQSDGTMTFTSNPCFDCQHQIFDPTIKVYEPVLRTTDPSCGAGMCRQWGFSSGSQANLSLSDVTSDCVAVFRVPVVRRNGPCRPC